MPQVSVIVPTFNRRRFLQPAVESVFAQTYTDWELVIADDGSDEETQAYLSSIRSPPARIIWLKHSGNPSRVRNAAIHSAAGRYLAFLDSDDVWAPTKLERQMRALQEFPSSRWCYTLENMIDAMGLPYAKTVRTFAPKDGWIFEPLLKLQLAMSMPTILASRDLVEEIAGFDEQLRFGEWHDFCLRLALKAEVVAVRESLCSVRTHDEHYSADRIGEQSGWMQLYKKMADLAPDREMRAYCLKVCADTSLRIAWLQSNERAHRASLATLARALPFAWRYPHWWSGALRRLLRPAIPMALISTFRRR
jgi:glycosyltransferase involved in cell wall biosynthesis